LFFLATNLPAQNSQYVNPFTGTGGHGHTFPGATVPFGMVQLSPDTRIDGSWDGCSGYHYDDKVIYGFSHTHLSGTGCSDYGDVMLMPLQKDISFDPSVYSSKFSHGKESASPGYYSVWLEDESVKAELTSSTRTGFHRYTYAGSSETVSVLLDLNHRDELLGYELRKISDRRFVGMRRSKAWASDQRLYFVIEFSQPVRNIVTLCDGKQDAGAFDQLTEGCKQAKVLFGFDAPADGELLVKVAISPVDAEGALNNLSAEAEGKNFDVMWREAEKTWNAALGKIKIRGGRQDHLQNFYTALYHSMLAPNVYNDADHRYRGRDGNIHTAEDFTYYTVFSLWDTFRAMNPLLTIIDPQRTRDIVQTFLAQYQQGGRLPVWELSCNETDCMIGYHSVSVITDAVAKGLVPESLLQLAFEAAVKSSTWDHLGVPAMTQRGYVATEDDHESVSKTLEYAYDDWCIIQLGKYAGLPAESIKPYFARSQAYRNLFDPVTGFFRPRANGDWVQPFDPREVNNHFTEANAWQYLFFVPHDIPGLIGLLGGKERFAAKLDSLFTVQSETTGRDQADITGLIGQYAHGNEPSHGFAYLFNYADQPWKAQHYLRLIMDSLYQPVPWGLPGNEDCGQMSAWYVFSALGFYPVTPGKPHYTWGTPLFEDVTIHLENGKDLRLLAEDVSSERKYISRILLNGDEVNAPVVSHSDLMNGGTIEYVMDDKPGRPWQVIFTEDKGHEGFVPSPLIRSSGRSFKNKQEIRLESLQPGCNLYYMISGGENGSPKPVPYKVPLTITESCTVYAFAKDSAGNESKYTSAQYYKVPHNWTVSIASSYNPQYTAGGDEGIIDGISGDINWRKGGWQGYQGKDFEAIIDLKKAMTIRRMRSSYLQDTRAWILMPVKVEYYISADGKNYSLAGAVQNPVQDNDYTVQRHEFILEKEAKKVRFVKVKAYNYGKLPVWHAGAGDEAFIFVDEITVE